MARSCNKCGDDKVVSLSSIDKKKCPTCNSTEDWPLEVGQESVLIKGKVGTKEKS